MHPQFFFTADYHPRLFIAQPFWTNTSSVYLQASSSTSLLPMPKPCLLNHCPSTFEMPRDFFSAIGAQGGVFPSFAFLQFCFKQNILILNRFFLGKVYTGQAQDGTVEEKCRQIFLAVPSPFLSSAAAGWGWPPNSVSLWSWIVSGKNERKKEVSHGSQPCEYSSKHGLAETDIYTPKKT